MSHIRFARWSGAEDFAHGSFDGCALDGERLVVRQPVDKVEYHDPHDASASRVFETATWESPDVDPGFGFSELIASWNTRTPPGTWVEIAATVRDDRGDASRWLVLGRWALDSGTIRRTSVPDQEDDVALVDVDTLRAGPGRTLTSWRLRATLCREAGTDVTPEIALLGAVVTGASTRPPLPERHARAAGGKPGTSLQVPTYSQALHKGLYAQFSGGGDSWCSPTSTAMVLTYFGAGPSPSDYAWVERSTANPVVVHAAAGTYDWLYGTGNWPFNTAYASEYGLRAIVTRLRSLEEAETLVHAGIPVIASLSFAEDELAGAGYTTEGHLLVIVGFTEAGDVIVHDPASHQIPSDDEVRAVYDRVQFEAAWHSGSGGTVYLMHPPGMRLPKPPAEANW